MPCATFRNATNLIVILKSIISSIKHIVTDKYIVFPCEAHYFPDLILKMEYNTKKSQIPQYYVGRTFKIFIAIDKAKFSFIISRHLLDIHGQ
jgi:hypothetical protein